MRKPTDGLSPSPLYEAPGARHGSQKPLTRIHELEAPFARVEIARIPEDAPEFQTPLGRALLDAARTFGWQVAVHRLHDKNEERKFRRAFGKYLCDWWDPDKAAIDVASALLALRLFPVQAFDPKVQRMARRLKGVIPTSTRRPPRPRPRKAGTTTLQDLAMEDD